MPSLLDPLPDEGQHLVDLIGHTYAQFGCWPVWQYVVQQAYEKYEIDADDALRGLPRWQWGHGAGYGAARRVPAAAGNAVPDIEARAVVTVYGLYHCRVAVVKDTMFHVVLKAVQLGAELQDKPVLSPNQTSRSRLKEHDWPKWRAR